MYSTILSLRRIYYLLFQEFIEDCLQFAASIESEYLLVVKNEK